MVNDPTDAPLSIDTPFDPCIFVMFSLYIYLECNYEFICNNR